MTRESEWTKRWQINENTEDKTMPQMCFSSWSREWDCGGTLASSQQTIISKTIYKHVVIYIFRLLFSFFQSWFSLFANFETARRWMCVTARLFFRNHKFIANDSIEHERNRESNFPLPIKLVHNMFRKRGTTQKKVLENLIPKFGMNSSTDRIPRRITQKLGKV